MIIPTFQAWVYWFKTNRRPRTSVDWYLLTAEPDKARYSLVIHYAYCSLVQSFSIADVVAKSALHKVLERAAEGNVHECNLSYLLYPSTPSHPRALTPSYRKVDMIPSIFVPLAPTSSRNILRRGGSCRPQLFLYSSSQSQVVVSATNGITVFSFLLGKCTLIIL